MEKPEIEKAKIRKITFRDHESLSIEVTEIEGEGGVVPAGKPPLNFDEMLKKITPFCESIISTFQQLSVKPNTAAAEFGLRISVEDSGQS